MPAKLRIFLTGATGYVGGCVLSRLIQHKNRELFDITALVRSEEKATKLKTLGINVVIGSYTAPDLTYLTEEVSKADIVFTIADSDTLATTQAILKGLKIRHTKSGKLPIFIHTSGSAFITDDAQGLTSEHITYSDLDVEKLDSIPESKIHRNVDKAIIEADKSGEITAYKGVLGAIFGRPSGLVADLGIQIMTSLILQYFIKPCIPRKQGGYFGKGINRWPSVSVDETADFYIVLLNALLESPDGPGHGSEGFYFLESDSYAYIDMARTISEALVEFGAGINKDPSPYTTEEIDTIFGPFWRIIATNCYAKGERSRALGWNPKSSKADYLNFIKEEVRLLVASEAK